jgi:prepilin-type processing-associated H-X9-DG protein
MGPFTGAPWDYTNVWGLASQIYNSVPNTYPLGDVASRQGVITTDGSRISQITDGLSSTLAVTECANRPNYWHAGRQDTVNAPWTGSCGPGCVTGGVWADHQKGFAVGGATPDGDDRLGGPCAINCTNAYEVYSMHPTGANCLFTDGSVHFLSASISIRTFAALCTRAGGEMILEEY